MAKKRAPRGGGSIRQRKDGRWEGRFSPGVDPLTGKRRYKSVYGATQAEARKKLAKAVAEIDEGTFLDPSKITVDEWAEKWLHDNSKGRKENSLKTYESMLRNHFLKYFGSTRLSAITTFHIQEALNAAPLAASSKITLRESISSLFTSAVKAKLIKENPVRDAETIKKPKSPPKILSDDQLSRVLAETQKTRFAFLFFFLAFTGVRIGEALGLTWDRIDFDTGFIDIDRQLIRSKQHGYIFAPPKNNEIRKLCPGIAVINRAREYKKEQTQKFLETGVRCPMGLVFCTNEGKPQCQSTVRNVLHKASAAAGTDIHPHDFRHTYASMALRAGNDPRTVQEALGHSSAAFTLEIYAAVNDQMRQESSIKMDDFMARYDL